MVVNKIFYPLAVSCYLAGGILCCTNDARSAQEAPTQALKPSFANKSAQEAIDALEEYLKKDTQGLRGPIDGEIGLQEYVEWGERKEREEPVWEMWVVVDNYKIINAISNSVNEVVIEVHYDILGIVYHTSCNVETGMFFINSEGISKVDGRYLPKEWINPKSKYVMRRNASGKWLIHDPMIPPHVYKDVVIRDLEADPRIKEFYESLIPGCFEKTLKALKSLP